MKIIFVGTGSGKTSRRRFHSSILIKSKRHNLLIDTGDGVSKALLELKISPNSIDSILLSHYHADHYSGIASLITQMKLARRTKQLNVYAHKNLTKSLNEFLHSSYLFQENLGFELSVNEFRFDTKQKISDLISFIPKQNSHITRKKILKKYPAEQFVSSSFLLDVGSYKIFYTSDFGTIDDLFLFKHHQIDYLISESTHLSAKRIFAVFKKLHAGELFLTHISDEDEEKITNWLRNLSKSDRKLVHICSDGLQIDLS